MRRRYRELDETIAGVREGDPELDAMADTARLLETRLDAFDPDVARERAFFVEAVAARRKRRGFWGTIGPILAGAAVVGAFAFAARSSLPGEEIYPLRKAIAAVGLVDSPNEEINKRLARATVLVNSAEEALRQTPTRATDLAFAAIAHLVRIERLFDDVGTLRATALRDELDSLERRATAVIAATLLDDQETGDDDDSSGPGSGSDDNSGPGDGGDSSGSGSGGDDDSDSGSSDGDSSGSGSGSEDNSGPGGGGNDSSGSDGGSDSSGSGGEGDSGSDGGD